MDVASVVSHLFKFLKEDFFSSDVFDVGGHPSCYQSHKIQIRTKTGSSLTIWHSHLLLALIGQLREG